jgi:hypothetical protein
VLRLSYDRRIGEFLYIISVCMFLDLSSQFGSSLKQNTEFPTKYRVSCCSWQSFESAFTRLPISTPLRAGRSVGRIPVRARFSAPIQTGPGAHPASYTMCTWSLPGVKRSGLGVDHPPPSSAEVKERVELYLYSPSGSSWPVLGWPLPLPYLGLFHLLLRHRLPWSFSWLLSVTPCKRQGNR